MDLILLKRITLIVIGCTGLVIIAVLIFQPDFFLQLRAQIPPVVPGVVEEDYNCTPAESAELGFYSLMLEVEDEDGYTAQKPVSVNVIQAAAYDGPSGEGEGGGDGGGDSGGDSGVEPELQSTGQGRTFLYQAETGHSLQGAYSEIRAEGQRGVAYIAHERALFTKQVSVPQSNYWLYLHARHDKPGPVDVAIYVNNKAWKVIRLNYNDNSYRTHRVGLLRNFTGATIRFRFLNDIWEPREPNNQELDRNLHLDWWALSENSEDPRVSSKPYVPNASPGRHLLQKLNAIIKEELGAQHINFDIWQYYAKRLVVVPSAPESIKTEDQLRQLMRYWKGIDPNNPKGQ